MHPSEIAALISRTPIVQSNEIAVQEKISDILTQHGIVHKREVVLGPGDRPDFMIVGGIAIEVKLKASKRAIYRQCERYCAYDQVTGLILVSATAMGFPEEIHGKSTWVASLGGGWL
jgi:hypothetical protein